jgi:hypothetical protein
MNATFIALPMCMLLIIGVATELENVAKDTSAKAIEFSTDMSNAMDCATRAIPISVCSPELMNQDFTPEKERFIEVLEEIEEVTAESEEEIPTKI